MTTLEIELELCLDCAEDLDHCHGAVIVHLLGAPVCTEDADCCVVAEAHRFVLHCEDPGCCGD